MYHRTLEKPVHCKKTQCRASQREIYIYIYIIVTTIYMAIIVYQAVF